jgi:predicted AlkP superfamily pyrophosphatase or phosphodiesterase
MCALIVGAELMVPAAQAAAEGPHRSHIYLVVVDGLDARWLPQMERTSRLRASGACPISYREAESVMPARTNTNHVSLLTGVYPAAHGITGNWYWDRDRAHEATRLEAAALIEVETLFTVIESEAPTLRTLGVFGKTKLARLFGEAPGRQHAPDVLWGPKGTLTVWPLAMLRAPSFAEDRAVMDAALAAMDQEPDLAVMSLAQLDLASHRQGSSSEAAREALDQADAQIARLIEYLHARGRWERSIVLITGDHGFSEVRPPRGASKPYISFTEELARSGITGLRAVSDGGVDHVYVERLNESGVVGAEAVELLRAARHLALRIPGVAEALYRVPLPEESEDATLGVAHPTWRLGHPRTGDLLLVAEPGVMFSESPQWRGVHLADHGGPGERAVPLVLCGGSGRLRRAGAPTAGPPSVVDVAVTVSALLGLRPAQRLDGRPVSPGNRGHVLSQVLVP